MKIINSHEIDSNNIFPCFSPPLAKFLVEVKEIHFVDIDFNDHTKKKKWLFIMNDSLKDALKEWSERGKNGNKIYE